MYKDDKYTNFAELKRAEPASAYRIRRRLRLSRVLIIAPHGGRIEPGTSQIAVLIAGETYNLYLFEGCKPPGQNTALHITSHRFDERKARELAQKCSIVLGIHGCRGWRSIYVGGRNKQLREDLAASLASAGLRVKAYGHNYPAAHPLNICNVGITGRGAQLEITPDLRRSPDWRERIARIARGVIEQHAAKLEEGRTSATPMGG